MGRCIPAMPWMCTRGWRCTTPGKGAKYTRARLPVSLLAYAEFATKHDAMHAEYVFKQLTRNEKDALLAAASHATFEEALKNVLT